MINPHSNIRRLILQLFHFTDEETETQAGYNFPMVYRKDAYFRA
jgi:hypothetical protein